MKTRNFILILALTLGAGSFGAARGLAYMRATYNGVCGELDGLPGLLQRANLFDKGNCAFDKKGNCGGECSIKPTKGSAAAGTCKKVGTTNATCQCMVS